MTRRTAEILMAFMPVLEHAMYDGLEYELGLGSSYANKPPVTTKEYLLHVKPDRVPVKMNWQKVKEAFSKNGKNAFDAIMDAKKFDPYHDESELRFDKNDEFFIPANMMSIESGYLYEYLDDIVNPREYFDYVESIGKLNEVLEWIIKILQNTGIDIQ